MTEPEIIQRCAAAIYRVMVPGHDWGSAGPLWREACMGAAREVYAELKTIKDEERSKR